MLPKIQTLDSYVPVYRDTAAWLPAMQAICRRHGLVQDSLRLAPPGSNIVFWVEPGCLIKLFAPMWAADAAREAGALHAMTGVPGIDVPRITAQGELEGWPYLVITRLPGRPLDELWPDLGAAERLEIARGLGRLMAALHSAPTDSLAALQEDWPAFLRQQVQACLGQQREKGVSPEWAAQIEAFLADLPPLYDAGFQPVLLHADLNPEHLFCTQGVAGWQVSGVIDFGDAMLGHPCYEFIRTSFLLGPNQPDLRRAMLLAYGYPAEALDEAFSCRMMAYTLLHRFASLPELLESFEIPPHTLAELQAGLWGLSGGTDRLNDSSEKDQDLPEMKNYRLDLYKIGR